MKQITSISLALALALMLSGCSGVPSEEPETTTGPIVAPVEPAETLPPLGAGQDAAALDQTTEAEKAAADAPMANGRPLGLVTVALGSPVEQGFWLRTVLVTEPGKGWVVTSTGDMVAVDLLPTEGVALLSLAAFRALGLALTDLPEVLVYAK
jgi:hypothetical protein